MKAFAIGQAPGRVNLLGEHTDYNDGFVLPVAISQSTHVEMRLNGSSRFNLHSDELAQHSSFTLNAVPTEHFATYVYGCLVLISQRVLGLPGLDIKVQSDVPVGVGLSSSAALEVATLRCLRSLLELELDDVSLAKLAQRAEIEFAKVRCGIMDQMASSLAGTQSALLIDTRTLQRRNVPLPPDCTVLVLDSGVARHLADSGYNERRAQCEAAAALLDLKSLRDVHEAGQLSRLPPLLYQRARHVYTENARVLAAAKKDISAAEFGRLMNESHSSLRDDYQVSTPELDQLVALLQSHEGVYGARLTGAGFGGACVALCRSNAFASVAKTTLTRYAELGHSGRQLVPAI